MRSDFQERPHGGFQRPTGQPIAEFWYWTRYIVEKDGCWIWTGPMTDWAFPRPIIKIGQSEIMAYRYVFEKTVGRIPKGLELDHLCCRRVCVNPNHLEPVTTEVNQFRWATFRATGITELERRYVMSL